MTSTRDFGLLALRLGLGGSLVAHGAQKLFGSFGGGGIAGTGAFFDQMGFKPGKQNAIAAGAGEFGGGALLALGLATPAAASAVAGTMVVAGSVHAPNGFFGQNGGFELPATITLVATALALTGPGDISLDHALGHALNRSWMRNVALGAVVPAAAFVISRRNKAVASAEAAKADAPEDGTGSAHA